MKRRLLPRIFPLRSRGLLFREAGSFRFSKGGLSRLVRKISGEGSETGRDLPSRGQAWTGLVLYGLLIPFGIWALLGRAWVTGTLLTGIGAVGSAGMVVRNLWSGPNPTQNDPVERRPR